jgi:nicotinamidase-related amidase
MSKPPQDFRPPDGATALVVVDVQEKLAPAMDPAALSRLVKATRTLLEVARQRRWPVVATEQYPQGLGRTLPEIAVELAAIDARPPLAKTTFSACGAEGFLERLGGALETRAAVVVGMEAHVCVLETALDLLARDLRVFVPWDAVASRREEDRTTALHLLRQAGAVVTSSESLAFQAVGRAGTPEFKAIAGRVR